MCHYMAIAYLFFISMTLVNLFFFFFSSRRRHTRCSRDWSSDVCSSDLQQKRYERAKAILDEGLAKNPNDQRFLDFRQRSEERRVGKSVDLGGRRIIKKKKKKKRKGMDMSDKRSQIGEK